ncbi:MAG TPA: thiamine phosphate synthase [Bacteroidia bacterium]|jgi:thiamine-phosphate pyrophosphorylase|nr:thiamine phosphate synthase [Bacteroidia bacterium]
MAEEFKIVVITPEKDMMEEPAIITGLFQAGLQTLHIRKPNHTRLTIKNLLLAIPKDFHSSIVLHQHYDLLNEFELKGAHLPEKRRKEHDTYGIRNIISTSFHKLEDITRERTNFEYAFFSPVFRSISKKGHESSVELKTLKVFFESHTPTLRFPIIALGGISEQNILTAKDIGFGGGACIGYIWENPDPLQQFKKIQNLLKG